MTKDTTDTAYNVWLASGGKWSEVYKLLPDRPEASVRRLMYERRKAEQRRAMAPQPITDNHWPDDEIDGRDVWLRAVALSERKLERAGRHTAVTFDYGPVCIVSMADWHLGGEGTDYARLERELSLIADTPGVYVGFVGDAIDNFIIGRLLSLRMSTHFTITEEWSLVRYALNMIAPKLLYVVGGNHDAWTTHAAGIDYLADIVRQFTAVPYDPDEMNMTITVGATEYKLRARHQWRLNSMFNPTHGIEQASRFDKGRAFDIGIGAHTHASGLSREFNNGGVLGLAILAGAYKRFDQYAQQKGFAQPNDGTAVAVILTEQGMMGTSNLELATDYMKAMYGQ